MYAFFLSNSFAINVSCLLFRFIKSKHEETLYKFLNDENIIIKDFNIISSDILGLTYERKHVFGPVNFTTHPIIASMVTSRARTILYEMIDKVNNHPATEVVYFDTDSIMVLCDPQMDLPELGSGWALGDWVNELKQGEVCNI
mgnify:CR=1 FL=1